MADFVLMPTGILCRCGRPVMSGSRRCPACRCSSRKSKVRRRVLGICCDCAKPAIAGERRCREHKEQGRQRNRARDAHTSAHGLCRNCGRRQVKLGTRRCEHCTRRVSWQRRHRLYGKSREQIEQLVSDQGHCCAACGLRFVGSLTNDSGKPGGRFAPVIDHDHNSGRVRGILHNSCNTALGLLGEEPSRIRSLGEYLERHREGGPTP